MDQNQNLTAGQLNSDNERFEHFVWVKKIVKV